MATFATCDVLFHSVDFANGFSRLLPAVGEQSRPQLMLSISLQGGAEAPSVVIPISDMHLDDWIRIRLGKACSVETTSGKSIAITIDAQQSLSALTISMLYGEGKASSTLFLACGSLPIRNVYKDMLVTDDNCGLSSSGVQLFGLAGGSALCTLGTVVKLSLVPPHLRPFFAQQMEAQRIALESSSSGVLGAGLRPDSEGLHGLAEAVRQTVGRQAKGQEGQAGGLQAQDKDIDERIRRGKSELASPSVYMPPPLWYGVLGGAVTVAMPLVVTQHAAAMAKIEQQDAGLQMHKESPPVQADAADAQGVAGGSPPHSARAPSGNEGLRSDTTTDLALIDRFLADLLRWKMFTSTVKADAEGSALELRGTGRPAGSSPTRSPSRSRRAVGTPISPSRTREAFPLSPTTRRTAHADGAVDNAGAWADSVLGDGYLRSTQGLKTALIDRGVDEQAAARLVKTFATAKVSPGKLGQASGRLLKLANLITEDAQPVPAQMEQAVGADLSPSALASQTAVASLIASTLPRTYRLLADKEAPSELREALTNLAQLSALRESLADRASILQTHELLPSMGGALGQEGQDGQLAMDVTAIEGAEGAAYAGHQPGRGRVPYIAAFASGHPDDEEEAGEGVGADIHGRPRPQDTATARPAQGATWWGKPPNKKQAAPPPAPPALNASMSSVQSVRQGPRKTGGRRPGQGAGRRPDNYTPVLPLVSGLGPLNTSLRSAGSAGDSAGESPVSGVRLPAHLRARIAAQAEQRRADRHTDRVKQEQEVQGGFGGNSAPSSRRPSTSIEATRPPSASVPAPTPIPVPSVVTGRTLRPTLTSVASPAGDADVTIGPTVPGSAPSLNRSRGTVISEKDVDQSTPAGLHSTAYTVDLPDSSFNRSGAGSQVGPNTSSGALSGPITVRVQEDGAGSGQAAGAVTISAPVPPGSLLPSPATAAGIDLAAVGSVVHAQEVREPSPLPCSPPKRASVQGRAFRQQARAGRRLDAVAPQFALMLSQAQNEVNLDRQLLNSAVVHGQGKSPSPSPSPAAHAHAQGKGKGQSKDTRAEGVKHSPKASAGQLDTSYASAKSGGSSAASKGRRRPLTAAAIAQIKKDEARAKGYKSVEEMDLALYGKKMKKSEGNTSAAGESKSADVSQATVPNSGNKSEHTGSAAAAAPAAGTLPSAQTSAPAVAAPGTASAPLGPSGSRANVSIGGKTADTILDEDRDDRGGSGAGVASAGPLTSSSFISPVLNSSLASTGTGRAGSARVSFAAAEAAVKAEMEAEATNVTRLTSGSAGSGSGGMRSPGTPALFKTSARRRKEAEEDEDYKDATFDSVGGVSEELEAAEEEVVSEGEVMPRRGGGGGTSGLGMGMGATTASASRRPTLKGEEADSLDSDDSDAGAGYQPSGLFRASERSQASEREGAGSESKTMEERRQGLNDTALTGVSAITGASSGKSSGLLSSISDTSL